MPFLFWAICTAHFHLDDLPVELLEMIQFNSQLNDLPVELLDMILQRSCLHLFMRIDKPENERDKDVIEKLASINFCCFKRVTRRRFKKAISSQLSLHYRNECKRRSIIRNNQQYLLETIQPTDEFLEKLQAEKCLTEDQLQSIKKLRRDFDKNWEILHALRPYSDKICNMFVESLRQTGQRRVAKLIDNGGVVAKITASEDQLIHKLTRKLNEFEDECESKENSLQAKMKIVDDDIELRPRDHDVLAWIWLKSRRMFMTLQYLIDSNSCKSIFMIEIAKKLKISEVCQEVNIDDTILQKEFVSIHPTSSYFEAKFNVREKLLVNGITKLKNEIYAINRSFSGTYSMYAISYSFNKFSSVIQVFEDRSPFRLLRKFEIKEIKYPIGLCSSERDNCLYVATSLYQNESIWMITRDEVVVRWVKLDFREVTSLSISFNDQMLAASMWGRLSVYDSDAKLVLSVIMDDILELYQAVETSNGSFVILCLLLEKTRERCSLSELSRDGKTFIRHFVPQSEDQMLTDLYDSHVCIDSDDRVFVLNNMGDRVILLDSDLCWMGILVFERQERYRELRRVFYDEKSKQLILGGFSMIVYRLN